MTWMPEGAAERCLAERLAQGLPPGIEDPETLRRIATILGPLPARSCESTEQAQAS